MLNYQERGEKIKNLHQESKNLIELINKCNEVIKNSSQLLDRVSALVDDKTIKNSIITASDAINNCTELSFESIKTVSMILEAMVQDITFLHEEK